ncbi:cupin domain-containing protein [Acidocella sp.]|uniref:cupin domain-containing protein n=1 Tax=Acidocella sp. TaxID=50710 RepID=UPI002631170F|nr:cupin domain-containing protein [Acidocella sp.]
MSPSRLIPLTPGEAPAWEPVPAAKLVAGQPQTRTTMLYANEAERLYVGEWEATPGKWRISYTEWESMQILEGRCIIEGDDGARLEAGPGDRFVIEPGFTGTWEVVSQMRKSWVIRE